MSLSLRSPFRSQYGLSDTKFRSFNEISNFSNNHHKLICNQHILARVTFSDPALVSKTLNPGAEIFQLWESDSCSDSGYHWSNRECTHVLLLRKWPRRLLLCTHVLLLRKWPRRLLLCTHVLLLRKWPRRLLLLLKLKRDSGSGFLQNFDSGSEEKRRILPESTPDPWPPMILAGIAAYAATKQTTILIFRARCQPNGSTFAKYCEVVMQCAYQCRQSARWLQGGYFYALKTSLEPYVKGLD